MHQIISIFNGKPFIQEGEYTGILPLGMIYAGIKLP